MHPLHSVLGPFLPKFPDCYSGIVRPGSVPPPTPPPPPPPPLPPIKPSPKDAKNVLFIISDDLRPEMMEAYGQKHMITPHFDELAKRSTVFNRAYCQQAICGPTRNSFLSGRRPQRTQSWNFIDHFREPINGTNGNEPARTEDGRTWFSFPGYFKFNGYTTLGGGKTYHPNLPPNNDGNFSWSPDKPYVNSGEKACTSKYFQGKSEVCPSDSTDLTDFSDYGNLQGMLDDLRYASTVKSKTGAPFFINYGIHKPHLPFVFPASFPDANNQTSNIWEKYGDDVALPLHEEAPVGMPGIAFTYELDGQVQINVFGESYPIPGPFPTEKGGCPFCGPALPDNITKIMRKGYYSAVSWIDFLVGQIVHELDVLGHMDDTVIAIVGDHGWQLGEHNIWGKHSNFELGARVPLIIHAPGQTQQILSNSLVESVDIYPTVAILAGLPPAPDLDGSDLSPVWKNTNASINGVSFSEYPRCAPPDAAWTPEPGHATPQSCVTTHRSNFTIMGYSVRTDVWRCTFWMWWNGEKLEADWARAPVAIELYSHEGDTEADFDAFENTNVASQNEAIVQQHMVIAKKQWQKTDATAI